MILELSALICKYYLADSIDIQLFLLPLTLPNLLHHSLHQHRQQYRRIPVHRNIVRFLLDLPPGDSFSHPSPRKRTIVLLGGCDIYRIIQAVAELVPPDGVVFAYPAPDHQRSRFLGCEDDVGQFLHLAGQHVEADRVDAVVVGHQDAHAPTLSAGGERSGTGG